MLPTINAEYRRPNEICEYYAADSSENKEYLEYFANKNSVKDFMKDKAVWDEDLTAYKGFYETVAENIEKIKAGICLL